MEQLWRPLTVTFVYCLERLTYLWLIVLRRQRSNARSWRWPVCLWRGPTNPGFYRRDKPSMNDRKRACSRCFQHVWD